MSSYQRKTLPPFQNTVRVKAPNPVKRIFNNPTKTFESVYSENHEDEDEDLEEAGFEYVTEMDSCKIFRKPK